MRLFPEWDMFATDFLRIPTEGTISEKKAIEHMGERIYQTPALRNKTTFQILTTARANTEQALEILSSLDINHLDLNLGCPSRRVNAHGGGSFLLSDLQTLEKIILLIRKKWNRCFTVKIRAGYKDDSTFEEVIKLMNNCGVEGITIHGRTRDQMYKGVASWDYFARAVKISEVPIIANGDIWTAEDIEKVFNETGAYAVMCARSAMKTPWLASEYQLYQVAKENFLSEKSKRFFDLSPKYFNELEASYQTDGLEENHILKKFKALIRYIFDDFEGGELFKRDLLRTPELPVFKEKLSLARERMLAFSRNELDLSSSRPTH